MPWGIPGMVLRITNPYNVTIFSIKRLCYFSKVTQINWTVYQLKYTDEHYTDECK